MDEEKLFFLKQKFACYSEVDEQVEKYEQSSGYRLSTGDSNRRKNATQGSAFEFSYKVYRCKKSGIVKSKGTGVRNKMSQKTNCPFTLRIKYTKVKKDKKNKNCKEFLEFLEISQLHLLHNHPPDCESLDTDSYKNDQQLLFIPEMQVSESSIVLEVTNEELELSDRLDSIDLHGTQSSLKNQSPTKEMNKSSEENIVNDIDESDHHKYFKNESLVKEMKKSNTKGENAENNFNDSDKSNDSKNESLVEEMKECNNNNENAKNNIDVNGDPKNKICEHNEAMSELFTKSDSESKVNEAAGKENLQEIDEAKNLTQNIETKKTRGRPKGIAKTAIGLPIKKQLIPFTNLSDKGKLKKILEWLTLPNSVINLVLNDECVLQYCDLQEKLMNLSDSFISDDIDLTLYNNYFDPKALRFFKIAIKRLKTNPVYTCKTCKSSVADDDESIACDLCLTWFHVACVGIKLTKKVKSKAWFCNYCSK